MDNFYGNIQVPYGNGDGTFSTGPTYTLDTYPNNIAAADLNGDGRTDILANVGEIGLKTEGTRIASLLAKHAGGFYWSSNLNLPDLQTYLTPLADFNGDGKPDLALSYQSGPNNSLEVFAGEGNGRFAAPQSFTVEPILGNEFAFPLTTGALPSILFRTGTSANELGLLLNESK